MNHYATIRAALESIRTCDDDIGERDAALSALAELEKAASVVVDYQYWHGDCWRGKQTWNGNTATVSRALYAAPPAIAAAPPVLAVEVSDAICDRVADRINHGAFEARPWAIAKRYLEEFQAELGVLDKQKLLLELGDVAYYLTRIASWFGMTLRQVLGANQAKLIDRQARGKVGTGVQP